MCFALGCCALLLCIPLGVLASVLGCSVITLGSAAVGIGLVTVLAAPLLLLVIIAGLLTLFGVCIAPMIATCGTGIAIVLIILVIIAAILGGIAAAIAAATRTGEMPDNFSPYYLSNETLFLPPFANNTMIQSLLKDGIYGTDIIDELSIFFPDEKEKIDMLKSVDEKKFTRKEISAKTSCSVLLETSQTTSFNAQDNEDMEQKVSNVFTDTINDILSESLNATLAHISSNIDLTMTQPGNYSSSTFFDIYFTVAKQFSCNEEGGDKSTICEKAFINAQGFIHDTKSLLEDFDIDDLSNITMRYGSSSGVVFLEENINTNSISCNSIDTEFVST